MRHSMNQNIFCMKSPFKFRSEGHGLFVFHIEKSYLDILHAPGNYDVNFFEFVQLDCVK